MVALAAMIPIAANRFDLSVAFTLGISQMLAIGLQGYGIPWPVVVVLQLSLGAVVGFANDILVIVVGMLGTVTLLLGINQWYSGGMQVLAPLPDSFLDLSAAVYGIPLPAGIRSGHLGRYVDRL